MLGCEANSVFVLEDFVRARGALIALLAAVVLVGTSACTYMTPQGTVKISDVSDGINATVGAIEVRNAVLLSEDGETGSLLLNLVNTSDNGISVKLQYKDASSTKVNKNVFVGPGEVTSVGGADAKQLVLDNLDTAPGKLFPVFVQYDDVTGSQLQVPVLDESFDFYAGLLPSASASTEK
jgi:hypothetical protein